MFLKVEYQISLKINRWTVFNVTWRGNSEFLTVGSEDAVRFCNFSQIIFLIVSFIFIITLTCICSSNDVSFYYVHSKPFIISYNSRSPPSNFHHGTITDDDHEKESNYYY